ncbi:hypothetical protein C4K68_24480 [Pokkaliibacter plantistimulans]|uniref:Uncharacterized protein n=1 Tax=Proteobacteria bacterium 228 TaxID=2083153 RepID=A0A2S5KI93_9PROT|nr:hypothetical protein [Pokkaliibacter plantistimulans]PPC74490.1 hypothetical protein C4K68_24480 [Pokkaliibacter plantistimulans]
MDISTALRRGVHRFVGLVVMVPSTLIALYLSMTGIGFELGAYQHQSSLYAATAVLVVFVTGWCGLCALWLVYFSVNQQRQLLKPKTARIGMGLLLFSCIALMLLSGGNVRVRILLHGWPLWAVAYFYLAHRELLVSKP